MKAQVSGVISRNMCLNRVPQQEHFFTDLNICPKLKQEQAISIHSLSKDQEHQVHFMSRTYTSKSIKQLLIKEAAMTLHDLLVLDHIHIPTSFFVKPLLFPLENHPIAVTVLPCLSLQGTHLSDALVPWSVSCSNDYRTFVLDADMGYVDFLIQYCHHQWKFRGKIEYQMYIYQKPLIFGKGTFVAPGQREISFYFGRILCCKEMGDLLMGAQ